MSHITYTELRQNLARYLDEDVESRAPIVVTRQGGKGNVVMLSEQEFAGWQETVHLLSNPVNAERLLRSIRAACDRSAGGGDSARLHLRRRRHAVLRSRLLPATTIKSVAILAGVTSENAANLPCDIRRIFPPQDHRRNAEIACT